MTEITWLYQITCTVPIESTLESGKFLLFGKTITCVIVNTFTFTAMKIRMLKSCAVAIPEEILLQMH